MRRRLRPRTVRAFPAQPPRARSGGRVGSGRRATMNTPNEPGAYAKLDGGIELWYRDEGNPDGEPMLLIMGLGSQLIAWPEDFVKDLGKRGYRVIRFDNRDCGLSTKIVASISIPAYWLVDMAADAAGLLAYLEIDQAHVVGASMGG